MNPVQMQNETRNIGKPDTWDEEVEGPCLSLSVEDLNLNNRNYMVSAWQPSKEELEALNNGGFVYLGICGSIHPVVFMTAAGE